RPRFWSSRRLAAPTPPPYWAPVWVPCTVRGPSKMEKLSRYLPFIALMAYTFQSVAAIQNVGKDADCPGAVHLVVNWTLPSWWCKPTAAIPLPAVLLGVIGRTSVQRTFPFSALRAKTWSNWVTKYTVPLMIRGAVSTPRPPATEIRAVG